MVKAERLLILDSEVAFPLVEESDHTVKVAIVIDFRGQELGIGETEESVQGKLKKTVFALIPEVMAEYVAISFALSDRDVGKDLEKELCEHLKILNELCNSALDAEIKKQEAIDGPNKNKQ